MNDQQIENRLQEISLRWDAGIIHSDCDTCRCKAAHAYEDIHFLIDVALDGLNEGINWSRWIAGGVPWLSFTILAGWFIWLVVS